jgi:hypothetical protein
MAVITLIGLVTMIIYPQFTISPEKSEIIYIGKLLKTDLNLVKEESFSSKRELSLYFVPDGYSYIIDETEISRSFLQYEFVFDVPVPEKTEPETTGENPIVVPSPNPVAGSFSDQNAENPDLEGQPKDDGDKELEPNQLKFTSDGKCNSYELSWQTMHFTGKLKVDQDGVLDWSYARK